ncbi:uroporphyrinogen-III synthase [Brucellaceae bacterium C25G]
MQKAGFVADVFPLTETRALKPVITIQGYQAVTVTSVNAFRHAHPELLQNLKHLTLFAVGERTAEVAREYGFETVIDGGGDALRLARTISTHLRPHACVLYLAGRVRQPIFEEQMIAYDLNMKVYDIYDTFETNPMPEAISSNQYAAVLLYSGVAASCLVHLQEKAANPLFHCDTKFLCIAPRVADLLPEQWKNNSFSADHPDENGIFRLFQHI